MGWGNFKIVHDTIKPPVWSRRLPTLSKCSLDWWVAVAGFAVLTLGPFGLDTRALTAHPPCWIQSNLKTRRRTKPAGLIESCMQGVGAPPQTPFNRRSRGGSPQRCQGRGPPLATPLIVTVSQIHSKITLRFREREHIVGHQ